MDCWLADLGGRSACSERMHACNAGQVCEIRVSGLYLKQAGPAGGWWVWDRMGV